MVVSKLRPRGSCLFVCDIQERFRGLINRYPSVIRSSQFLVRTAKLLDLPVIATEQYPKVLGHTVPELQEVAKEIDLQMPMIAKTRFSMVIPEVEQKLNDHKVDSVILVGIEAHVCVLQTCLDLLERGIHVHVVADAVSSQKPHDRAVALQRMQEEGAVLTTSESVVFQLMEDSKFPRFKEVSALIKERNKEENEFANSSHL